MAFNINSLYSSAHGASKGDSYIFVSVSISKKHM
jgi:hypothetical protein